MDAADWWLVLIAGYPVGAAVIFAATVWFATWRR
jgi:hypothetical protein